jgi:hypothetical protein
VLSSTTTKLWLRYYGNPFTCSAVFLFSVVSFPAAAVHLTMSQVSYVSWLLLCVAAGLAAWSLAIYFANVWTHFVAPPQPQPVKKAA